jgi:hypothetical protein
VAPSQDPSKDAVAAAAGARDDAALGRNAEARSVLSAIDSTVLAGRRADTRDERRRRTARFVTLLFSDA